MNVGDLAPKEFFIATRERSGASTMITLEDERGTLSSAQPDLKSTCHQFYSKLFQVRARSVAGDEAEAVALQSIRARLLNDAKVAAPISTEELDKAIEGMASAHAPDPDDVLPKFFKKFWSIIKLDYLGMIQESIRKGSLPLGVSKGFILLLYKSKERIKLTNSRPITLLIVVYKLFAKVLQIRLQSIFMDLISFDQSAFLPMRFILDNILLIHETLE